MGVRNELFPLLFFAAARGSNDVQHLPGQRDPVQRGQREGDPTLCPLDRIPRQARPVLEIPADHCQDGEPVHQVINHVWPFSSFLSQLQYFASAHISLFDIFFVDNIIYCSVIIMYC